MFEELKPFTDSVCFLKANHDSHLKQTSEQNI